MTTAGKTGSAPPRSLPEAIARTLRHEVGDLLQTIYAAVAILQKRLPPDSHVERRILADTRRRAGACKDLLDAVHDYVCPLSLALEQVDLTAVARSLADTTTTPDSHVVVHAEASGPAVVIGDPKRLTQLGSVLLANANGTEHQHVWFKTCVQPASGTVQWVVYDDGPFVPDEQLAEIFTPFATTRSARPGVGLALAQKIVALHGGRITAANVPGGGFEVRVTLPVTPPNELAPAESVRAPDGAACKDEQHTGGRS
jgi:signal transduction histidine kinase